MQSPLHILFYESKMYIILSTEPYCNYEIKCNFKNDTDHWEKKYFHEKNKFLLLILVIVITLPPKATLFIGPDFRCTETVKYYSTKLSPSRETTIHIRPLFQCWKWGLIKGETTVSIIHIHFVWVKDFEYQTLSWLANIVGKTT
jgi:hypothetical protein